MSNKNIYPLITKQQTEDFCNENNIKFIFIGTDGQKYIYKCLFNSDSTQKILEKNTNPLNRKIGYNYINNYIDDMQNDNWQDNGESIKFYFDFMLADGQHRLTAINKSNAEIWLQVHFGLSKDINNFDSGRKRNLGHQLTMMDEGEMAKQSAIINNLTYLEENNAVFTGNKSNSLRITVANKFKKSIEQYKSNFQKELNGHISAWAALIWVSQYHPNEVKDFIDKLILGSNLNSDSPILHLRNYLFKTDRLPGATIKHKIAMLTLYCFLEYYNLKTMRKITPKMYEKKYSYDILKTHTVY